MEQRPITCSICAGSGWSIMLVNEEGADGPCSSCLTGKGDSLGEFLKYCHEGYFVLSPEQFHKKITHNYASEYDAVCKALDLDKEKSALRMSYKFCTTGQNEKFNSPSSAVPPSPAGT